MKRPTRLCSNCKNSYTADYKEGKHTTIKVRHCDYHRFQYKWETLSPRYSCNKHQYKD